MAKQEYEICDVDLYGEWRLVEGGYNGTMEKVLSYDPETGNYTRLLKFPLRPKSLIFFLMTSVRKSTFLKVSSKTRRKT